jgi:hypothetical protein
VWTSRWFILEVGEIGRRRVVLVEMRCGVEVEVNSKSCRVEVGILNGRFEPREPETTFILRMRQSEHNIHPSEHCLLSLEFR